MNTHSLGRGLVWLGLVLLAALGPLRAEDGISVYFGPRSTDDETGVYAGLMRFIDDCDTSIYGSIHELNAAPVAERLAARAAAGVRVELVLERRWWDEADGATAHQILGNSRVVVHLDTKSSGLMHNKFLVGDGERVWTGSTNLTWTCLLVNPNNAVRVESVAVAANFLTEFEEERNGGFGKLGSGAMNTRNPLVAMEIGTVRTIFSPEDEPVPALVAAIDGAREELAVMAFVFSSNELAEAMLRAQARGVHVRVLLDNVFSSDAATARWRYVPAKVLAAAGIAVVYDNEPGKLHHKVLVVDRRLVVTGSFNLSANAAKSNDENLLIIDSPAVATLYQAEFERLWQRYAPAPRAVTLADGDGT